MKWPIITSLTFLLVINSSHANQQHGCDPLVLKKHDAPFDYHDQSVVARERLRLAEGAHFTQSVRTGVAGNAGTLIDDLNFVLRVFPNHPYALAVMADVQSRPGFSRQRPGRRDYYYPTMNCYYQRALQIAPSDPAVFLVMAIQEHKQKNYNAAKNYYNQAIAIKPDIAEAHYNLGLLLVTTDDLTDALKHAHKAYALGHPLPGLRDKLKRKGAWQEPEVTPAKHEPITAGQQ